jgi:hypothetical protein
MGGLLRGPSPFDFSQGQDDSKGKSNKGNNSKGNDVEVI